MHDMYKYYQTENVIFIVVVKTGRCQRGWSISCLAIGELLHFVCFTSSSKTNTLLFEHQVKPSDIRTIKPKHGWKEAEWLKWAEKSIATASGGSLLRKKVSVFRIDVCMLVDMCVVCFVDVVVARSIEMDR
jgi:hypothetical protein